MKVVITKKSLVRLIDRCLPAAKDGFVGHGKTVLMTAEVDPKQLRLAAVGVKLAVDCCDAAKNAIAGSTVVDAVRLRSLVEAMPEGDVTLVVKDDKLTVSAQKRKYTLPVLPVASFPQVPEMPENETPYLISSDALAHVLETTQYAIRDSQEHLDGVLVILSKNQLEGAAVSGATIALATVRAQGVAIGAQELFIPRTMIPGVLALCKEQPNVSLDEDGRRLFVETEDTLLSSALPAAERPPWRKVLDGLLRSPVCAVDSAPLASATKAMLTVSPKATLRIQLEPPLLKLSLMDDDSANGEEPIEVQVMDNAAKANVAINAQIFLHAVEACAIVELAVASPSDPVIICAQDKTFQSVIMPLQRF